MWYKPPTISQKKGKSVFSLEVSVCNMIRQGIWKFTGGGSSETLLAHSEFVHPYATWTPGVIYVEEV